MKNNMIWLLLSVWSISASAQNSFSNFSIKPNASICDDITDPSFDDQWNLTDNPNFPLADINVCPAWEITKGINTKIAVLDVGIKHCVSDLNVIACEPTSPLPLSGDCYYNQTFVDHHGTNVAGIICAEHNNIGIAGIAPDASLYNVANPLFIPFNHQEVSEGLDWAVFGQGVDVVNMSFGNVSSVQNSPFETMMDSALIYGRGGLGTVLVAGAGNTPSSLVGFPANYSGVIAVGGTGREGEWNGFNHGFGLDVSAPSAEIPTTAFGFCNGDNDIFNGTSAAAPHVAGVASLMIAASDNQGIVGEAVGNIIKRTAQKVGSDPYISSFDLKIGSWNSKLGHGIVDAKECVYTADAFDTQNLDVHMRNSLVDYGVEPDNVSPPSSGNHELANSPDIWIWDNDIYGEITPTYTAGGNTVNVMVRVINKSNTTVDEGALNVELYWSKQHNAHSWPFIWNGSTTVVNNNGQAVPSGGMADSGFNDVEIRPGEQYLYFFSWDLPNPDSYEGVYSYHSKNSFSLLARINSAQDPMTVVEGADVYFNTKKNNNIAWKNVQVQTNSPGYGFGLRQDAEAEEILIYPNPLPIGQQILFKGVQANAVKRIKVFDVMGNLKMDETPMDQVLDVGKLSTGIYVLKFQLTYGREILKKVLIE